MKSFFCIILRLLLVSKSVSEIQILLTISFKMITIHQLCDLPIFGRLLSKFLKYSAEWGFKGQLFSSPPSSKSATVSKSVIFDESKVLQFRKYLVCGISHPVFGQFILKLSC